MLTLRFIPYYQLREMSSQERIAKIVEYAKEDNIILIEGKLRKTEEVDLIKKTMEEISDKFKGIEIAEIYPERKKDVAFFTRIRDEFINFILGDRQGFTIIGPATIIKEIKKDPNRIQLLTKEPRRKQK
ncbi:DUF2073 domain-containing protein [Candidatus Woesearchaeota archaeon]|nr:DUF2073 domain-containing protein [Candidatus Woesearchaeota archaeon]